MLLKGISLRELQLTSSYAQRTRLVWQFDYVVASYNCNALKHQSVCWDFQRLLKTFYLWKLNNFLLNGTMKFFSKTICHGALGKLKCSDIRIGFNPDVKLVYINSFTKNLSHLSCAESIAGQWWYLLHWRKSRRLFF